MKFKPAYIALSVMALVILSSAAAICTRTYIMLLGILFVPTLTIFCLLWRSPQRAWPLLLRNRFIIPLLLLVFGSIYLTSWPMRAHFLLARPAFNRIAVRLEQGEKIADPMQIGLVRVIKTERITNSFSKSPTVCLWTFGSGGAGDFVGFAKTSPKEVSSRFNLWDATTMDSQWQFVEED